MPESAGWEASTVAGIFGANASGKSNVLEALVYMRDTVRWSMNNSEPGGGVARTPFALSAEAGAEPSTYVVDLMICGVRHTYGFAVDDTEVVEEWLYRYPKRRKRVVFERDEDGFSFGEESRSKLRQVEQLTGSNVLFLTVAARTGQALPDRALWSRPRGPSTRNAAGGRRGCGAGHGRALRHT